MIEIFEDVVVFDVYDVVMYEDGYDIVWIDVEKLWCYVLFVYEVDWMILLVEIFFV